MIFLAHYVGGGIDQVLDLTVDDFFLYVDFALDFYKQEIEAPRRVVLSGIEKR